MITTATEYYRNLYRIQQDHNLPSLAVMLPSNENIYEIDLNARTVEAPEFLGTLTEHMAEVIYFKCDRFFDYMDLANCAIVVQFKNAKGEGFLYAVPFVDAATYSLENKILIPWCVDGNVTAQAGEVTFSIRFYKIDVDGNKLVYSLTTLPTKVKVLETMDFKDLNGPEFELTPTQYEQLVYLIQDTRQKLDLEWIVL